MTLRSLAIVLVVWAAIYLPGLGTLEIKGEEGRRILPAVTMLQTGNVAGDAREWLRSFIVPQVGSDPYFTKPPLVNWLAAASFKLFHARNEWTARLPSVLAVLAVALAFGTIARGALGPNGSLAAALIWLTNFGIIEKGRLIEIEALYASLTGLAIICWLAWWQERRSRWLTWIVPWFFLGLAMLAKGPLNLVFFYAIVLAVLYRTRELRTLISLPHLLGIILMVAIFAAWAIPCLQIMRDSDVAHTWTRQFSGRLVGEDFHLSGWLLNIPRGLGYFLPWVLLLPFLKSKRRTSNVERRTPHAELPSSTFDVRRSAFDVRSGLLWGIATSFLCVSLLPGALARYTMPLLAPAAWLMAMCLTAQRFESPNWLRPRWPQRIAPELRLPAIVAAAVCIAIAVYASIAMPFLKRREKVRPLAAQINAALPPAAPLYAVDPDYQPFLFYVRDPIVYVPGVADLPATARDVLVQGRDESAALNSEQWQPLRAQPVLRLRDYRGKRVTLLRISDAP